MWKPQKKAGGKLFSHARTQKTDLNLCDAMSRSQGEKKHTKKLKP